MDLTACQLLWVVVLAISRLAELATRSAMMYGGRIYAESERALHLVGERVSREMCGAYLLNLASMCCA